MKTSDYTQVNAKTAQEAVEELQILLSDFQVFYANLRGFHWNVRGCGFFHLHEVYEKMYDDAAEKADEIAERILMLGGIPAHNFSDYLKTARIKETGVVSDGDEIAGLILEALKVLIAQERKILKIASEGGDETTAALVSDFISEQEKTIWMVTAYLS